MQRFALLPQGIPPSNKNVAKIINSDLVLVRAAHQKTTLNKPIAVGFSTNSNSYAICHIFIVIVARCYASATCYHAACLFVRVCLSVCHIRRSNVAHHIYVCLSIFCVRMPIYITGTAKCPSVTRRYSVDTTQHMSAICQSVCLLHS